MRKRTGVGLRTWVLGAAATGLLSQSFPAVGQSKNAASANAKKPAAKTTAVQSIQPPQLLAVPNTTDSGANVIIPASQMEVAASDKSEVQRQLEMLYEKDGREMPDMKINLQPIGSGPAAAPAATGTPAAKSAQTPAPATQKPSRVAPGYTKYQPSALPAATVAPVPLNLPSAKNPAAVAIQKTSPPQAQTQAPSQPHQNRITGFFKRFVPSSRKAATSTAPIPPDYVNSAPEVPPTSAVASFPMPSIQGTPNLLQATPPKPRTTTPTMQLTTKPVLSPVPLQTSPLPLPSQAPIVVGFSPSPTRVPQATLELPPLAQEPMPLAGISDSDITMPPLMTEPDPRPLIASATPNGSNTSNSLTESGNDFPDPSPELAENQAELKGPTGFAVADVAVEKSNSPGSTAMATDDEGTLEASNPDEDPYAVRVKDFSEPRLDETVEVPALSAIPLPMEQSPLPLPAPLGVPQANDSQPDLVLMPPAPPMPEVSGPSLDVGALKPVEVVENSYLEKMRRIRDRFGMKGLKGFCPVTLRDERELLDAKPEFFFTHRGQKFHFASAEARDKFEVDPATYAPAAYGADVVALGRDKDVVEGTLDFAAWYKGRLYLFGSQANYDVFVKSPVTYASPAEID